MCRRLVLALCALALSTPAFAQNWSFDARKIGMGSVGGSENLSTRMIEDESEYRSIVLPFGLFQVLRDFDVFNPDSDEFDIVRSVEYAAAPLHYVIGRDEDSESGRELVVDIRNATLSRDLNTYRGFAPVNQPVAEGLASPNWGATIKLHRGERGAFQGVYVGAGPYFSMRSGFGIDERLTELLASDAPQYIPNTTFLLGNDTRMQAALAIIGGYRARFAWAGDVGSGSEREGLYVAVNYNYLRGFRYENIDTSLRLNTDAQGLLTFVPQGGSPLAVIRQYTDDGTGAAVDMGIGAVLDRWEFGFGVRGIANHMDWRNVEQTTYTLGNLFLGDSEFDEQGPVLVGEERVELPIDYRANAAVNGDAWTAAAEFGSGFQGTSFRAGLERRMGAIDVRAGAGYARELWQPTVGVGLNLGPKVSFDIAMFGTSANAERERRQAIAVSLRINR